jgi:hypothetical protein
MKIKTLVKSAALAALFTLPASAQADVYSGKCQVTEVYAFSNRVHAKCSEPVALGIQYFAVPTSSSAEAARFTTMASMALGDYLWVYYDDFDFSAESFGCLPENCRRPVSFRLAQ